MRRLSIPVAVLGFATLFSLAQAQFTPQWQVGDWWVVKEQCPSVIDGAEWQLQPWRYDVLGIENVGGHDCFVLQKKVGDTTAAQSGVRNLYCIRMDDWKAIRRVRYSLRAGKLRGPSTVNYPKGMFGTGRSEPRLPLFPLDTAAVQDSAFRRYEFPYHGPKLRQFCGLADSAVLNRYLSDPDTSRERPVQLGEGPLIVVLIEGGAPRDSSVVPATYSLQLWSRDYPWRLYEERGVYLPGTGVREADSRSWLIRCGHSEK